MSDPIDPPDPDLDDLTRGQLAELAHMPEIAATADVLDAWVEERFGGLSADHGVGLFLGLLAAKGYRIEPIAPVADFITPTTGRWVRTMPGTQAHAEGLEFHNSDHGPEFLADIVHLGKREDCGCQPGHFEGGQVDDDELAGDCTDPPRLQCSDAGCPEHGFDRERDDDEDQEGDPSVPENLTYVRWKSGEPRIGLPLPPLGERHPAIGMDCPLCHASLQAGDPMRVFVTGIDPADRAKLIAGHWFSAQASVIHDTCADAAAAWVRANSGSDIEATPIQHSEDR